MSLDASFQPPNPDEHGWKIVEDGIQIVWMNKDPAPRSVLELISCKTCKKCSTKHCPCKKHTFKCTDACGCNINTCENSEDTGRCHFDEEDDDEEDEEDEEDMDS